MALENQKALDGESVGRGGALSVHKAYSIEVYCLYLWIAMSQPLSSSLQQAVDFYSRLETLSIIGKGLRQPSLDIAKLVLGNAKVGEQATGSYFFFFVSLLPTDS